MKKLIHGILEFREKLRPAYRDHFAELALGQKPDVLMFACSDSRVAPNVFASTDPGDLFVVRNVGAMVPPHGAPGFSAEAAALEFSLANLPISNIIVCGHSNCGAVRAIRDGLSRVRQSGALANWLELGKPALENWKERDTDPTLDRLSQQNVLEQIRVLGGYPIIRERVSQGKLRLHAWWFNIADAEVHGFDESTGEFRPIDAEFARVHFGESPTVQG